MRALLASLCFVALMPTPCQTFAEFFLLRSAVALKILSVSSMIVDPTNYGTTFGVLRSGTSSVRINSGSKSSSADRIVHVIPFSPVNMWRERGGNARSRAIPPLAHSQLPPAFVFRVQTPGADT
jgi:hypothetical protein